jgi:hypothetical protein
VPQEGGGGGEELGGGRVVGFVSQLVRTSAFSVRVEPVVPIVGFPSAWISK